MAPLPDDPLASFHPLVRTWFTETLGEPSPPQRAGWPAIARGDDTLILAPTGTGKTLAAFLFEIDALIRDGQSAPLANAVHLVYVSPLKALSNDVQRNLERPLAELKARFWTAGEHFPEIRVAVRTGDTTRAARARMLRRTPHILITTPESLHLLLTSVRGRSIFSALRAVIVDEVHAVAGTKRGAHLALTLERLALVAPAAPQRIALSATQRPLHEIARFLGGCDTPRPGDSEPRFRPVEIVDCGLVKRMETRVVSPVPDLAHVDGTIWPAVVPLVVEAIGGARTTLIFVNNRGQAERMAARINALTGRELALPYHGSLSRERRFLLEERLKAGELRGLVTTSSLELGIDVGSVDLVVQLQSPKRVASALQRVGRAGHTLHAASRGLFVPTFRDDALEELAIVRAMHAGDVEPTRVVQNALDVLAQLLVAMVASEESPWTATALFDVVRRAYPYHALSRGAFDETLAMLAGKYPADVASELDARVHWDRVSDLLTPSRAARLVATTSGGTIPDRGLYTVTLPDRTRLGELDEEFVHESRVGDAFQLGSSTWRIRAIEHDRVIVVPAPGAPARMPFWHGEFQARSAHLAAGVGELRRRLAGARTEEQLTALREDYHADEATVRSLVDYAAAQRASTRTVPDDRRLVLEYFRDELGSWRLVLHAPFGGRVLAPWGMALGRRLRERLGVDVQVQTSDDGILLRLPSLQGIPPLDVVMELSGAEAERLVLEEVGSSSLFGARFRMNAARALLLPRGNPRRRMPLWLQRLKAADLLQAVQGFPSFPIVVETYREVLQDTFDLPALREVLAGLADGRLAIDVAHTELPSPFATSLQFGLVMDWMYGDDTPRAESRAALLSLDRALLDEVMGGDGADAETLAMLEEVLARRRGTATGRQARDADELAVLVDRAGDVTWDELQRRVAPAGEWVRGDPVVALLKSGRLVGISLPDASDEGGASTRFLLVDAWARYAAALGLALMETLLAGEALERRPASAVIPEALRGSGLTPSAAKREVLSRHVALAGPVAAEDITARYGFPRPWVERRMMEWERSGVLVRGAFGGERKVTRWSTRRLLEQARRLELARARRAVAPVSLDAFAHFLVRWQHVADQPAHGAAGVADVLAQLDGIARPAASWERDYLPARIADYEPALLDAAVASGSFVWAVEPAAGGGRARGAEGGAPGSNRLGRVRFFTRGTGRLWLRPPSDEPAHSDRARQVLEALRVHGASFTADLANATALGPQRVRDALRELVAAGFVTNDTVGALRDVLRWKPVFPLARADEHDPARWLPADFTPSFPRRHGHRRPSARSLPRWQRPDRPQGAGWGGRWSLVHGAGVLGTAPDDPREDAEAVARQWLLRYGVVSRDWWKRERPAVAWREIYHELKRLEFRGEVRRGYFIAGLAGAQFAVPDALEMLRQRTGGAAPARDAEGNEAVDGASSSPRAAAVAPIVLATSDPANAHVFASGDASALARPRGSGARLVLVHGAVVATAEAGGSRLRVRAGMDDATVHASLHALVARLGAGAASRRGGGARRRDLVVETIDALPAATSPYAPMLRALGFRTMGQAMRRYADIR